MQIEREALGDNEILLTVKMCCVPRIGDEMIVDGTVGIFTVVNVIVNQNENDAIRYQSTIYIHRAVE